MDLYATSTGLPLDGTLTHLLSRDGLRMESTYDGPEGSVTIAAGWEQAAVARANYESAMRGAEKAVLAMVPDLDARPVRQRLRVVRTSLGTLRLFVASGPKVGLAPHAATRLRRGDKVDLGLQVSVLRRRIQASFEPRSSS